MFTLILLTGFVGSPHLVYVGEFRSEQGCQEAAKEWKKQAVKAVCHNFLQEKTSNNVLRKN